MSINRIVCEDTYYVGASNRKATLFENIYPITHGASFNSYIIMDEKTCLFSGTDESVTDTYLERVKTTLGERKLDYLVIQHMEPDHSSSLKRVIETYPEVTIVLNAKIHVMFNNFNPGICLKNVISVNENDTLSLGKHTLVFINAPMVHWPEVMFVYDTYTKSLFSADAFGTFGALDGEIIANKDKFDRELKDEARRYYTNIVGKYGVQVQSVLKKAAGIQIENILPLHGPIWKDNLAYYINLYDKWSRYEPEVNGVMIVYGSIYGHTEEAANLLAEKLALLGVKDIVCYNASITDKSYLLAEVFKYSHIVFASSTYNMGIFTPIDELITYIQHHAMQNRKYSIIENGSWAPNSGKLMIEKLSTLKGFEMVGEKFTFKSAIKPEDVEKLDVLAKQIAESVGVKPLPKSALYDLTYGLFVLGTENDGKQNGCIINTVNQVASNPDKLMISVNKANYSAETLIKTKKANLSILTTKTPFDVFKRFGFQSGRNVDKYDGFSNVEKANNGINYLTRFANAYISVEVIEVLDLGSHYGFICSIVDSKVLNDDESLTYAYYMREIKPQTTKTNKKKGWVCKICGYVYEGEVLPKDFICPICKHGAEDFEEIK